MPISYELAPLTDLMCYEQFVAFENALRSIYGQYIGAGSSANEYPLDMHFGVFRGDGEDVSLTPFDQRVILQSKPQSAPFYLYPRTKGNSEQFSIDVLGYGLTWRGKPARPLPMFATLIHGGIGQVEEEENAGYYFERKKLYTEGGLVSAASSTSSTSSTQCFSCDESEEENIGILDYQNFFPFAKCSDTSSECKLSFTQFVLGVSERFKPAAHSFSFLQVNNRMKDDFVISGIVTSDGIAIDDFHDNYNVHKAYDEDSGASFSLQVFGDNFQADNGVSPIATVFPRVEDDNYPDTIRDVSLFIIPEETGDTPNFKFGVKPSFSKKGVGFAPVGFNFLVCSPEMESDNIRFGYIHGVPSATDSAHRLYGLDIPTMTFSNPVPFENGIPNSYEFADFKSEEITKCAKAQASAFKSALKIRDEEIEKCNIITYIFSSCKKKAVNDYFRKQLEATLRFSTSYEDVNKGLTRLTPEPNGDDKIYSFPSTYYGSSRVFALGTDSIRNGTSLNGGVKIPFSKPFESIPSVTVTPVFSDDLGCSMDDTATAFQTENIGELKKERLTNVHHLLQCMVETITKEYCFVKCVCIKRKNLFDSALSHHNEDRFQDHARRYREKLKKKSSASSRREVILLQIFLLRRFGN